MKWPKSHVIQSTHKIKVLRQNGAKGNDQELMKSIKNQESRGHTGEHWREIPNGVREERGQSRAHGAAAALNLLHRKAGLK